MKNMTEIKRLRLEKGLTQVDVAIACGVSKQAYMSWEYGVSKPNEENQIKLDAVLKESK